MNIKLSACTITKNEEKNIERSINSYKDYVDEIIIVDTGSTDNTVAVSKSLGAKVIEYKWNDDFAAARNCALENATGDWIIFLDADEWIAENGAKELKKAIETAIENKFDALSCRLINLSDSGNIIETMSILRLFARKPAIKYRRKIHEILYDFDKKQALESLYADSFSINHSGYAKSISKDKIIRNRKLLEKVYASGEAEALDYFYLARENLTDNPVYADYFLNLLISSNENMEKLKDISMGNNIHELKIRISNILTNKYSFEQRLGFIEAAIADNPFDPLYYYYKYVLYSEIDNLKYKELLEKAVALDKEYEKKAKDKNNAFYKYKFEAYYELALCELKEGNNVKALDYLVYLISNGQRNSITLRLLLSVISNQNSNEIIAFLDSLIDTSLKEELQFIIETLRLSEYKEVFLYYFVKFYKLFGEFDISFFTSRMITGNAKEMFEKYLNLYNDTKQEKALILMMSALIVENMKEDYIKIKNIIPFEYRKVLLAFFEGSKFELEENTKKVFSYIFAEISYVMSDELLYNLTDSFVNKEEVREFIIDYYLKNFSFAKVINYCKNFIDEELSDYFAGKVTAVLGYSYFSLGDFENAIVFLEQAIKIGYLDNYVKTAYEKIVFLNKLEPVSEFEPYKECVYRLNVARKFESVKIEDFSGVGFANDINSFENSISEKYNVLENFLDELYDFSKKNFEKGNLYLAEEYYKLLLKCDYKSDLILFDLGKIYNIYNHYNLSYYCYKNAFLSNLKIASNILSENHVNYYYLYSDIKENKINVCPVCGEKGREKCVCCYIEEEKDLGDNSPVVLYDFCEKCNHLFAENYRNNGKIYKYDISDEYVFNSYDIIEKLSVKTIDTLVVVDDREELIKICKENYDSVEQISNDLMKVNDLNEFIKNLRNNRGNNTYLLTVISDYSNTFEECFESGMINCFSKKSVKKLLNKYGFSEIEVYNSKYLRNKLIVTAKF